MLRYILAFIGLLLGLLPTNLFAFHIVGGEITYECLGDNQYLVTLTVYRDCHSTGALYDDPAYIYAFRSNGSTFIKRAVDFPAPTR